MRKRNHHEDVSEDEVVSIAFLASDPATPHGQLWDVAQFFPEGKADPRLHTSFEREPGAAEAVEWMESYDGLACALAQTKKCIKLAKVYGTWDEIRADLMSERPLPFQVLWAGSWLFHAVGTYLEDEPERQQFMLDDAVFLMTVRAKLHGVVVFPPVEYVLMFARKHNFLLHMVERLKLPLHLNVPPTILIDCSEGVWRERLQEFADLYGVDKVVMKREVSGRGNHVVEGHPKSVRKAPPDTLQWFIQPYCDAFDR